MQLVIENRYKGFKLRAISFAQEPSEQKGCDRATFSLCLKPDSSIHTDFKPVPIWHTEISLKQPLEDIFKGFNDTTRNEINQAEKKGITYKLDEDFDGYINLQNRFIEEKRTWLPKIKSYTYLDQFSDSIVLTAYYNDRLIAGALFIIEDGLLWLRHQCSVRLVDDNLAKPSSIGQRLLVYKGIEEAKKRNAERLWFQLGRDLDAMDGVARFKQGFGGQLFQKNIYYKDYSPLLKLAGKFGIGAY